MGFFRVAKVFEVEYAHRLAKHPEKCRFPHGHCLRIEIVLRGRELDEHDMVCDYKALKLLVQDLIGRLDHALAVNGADPHRKVLEATTERLLIFEGSDPTTEVLARWLYNSIAGRLGQGGELRSEGGAVYRIPDGVELERVRVWETARSWGEYVGLP